MPVTRVQVRVYPVEYEGESQFEAHYPEYDLTMLGRTEQEALDNLREEIESRILELGRQTEIEVNFRGRLRGGQVPNLVSRSPEEERYFNVVRPPGTSTDFGPLLGVALRGAAGGFSSATIGEAAHRILEEHLLNAEVASLADEEEGPTLDSMCRDLAEAMLPNAPEEVLRDQTEMFRHMSFRAILASHERLMALRAKPEPTPEPVRSRFDMIE